MNNVKTDSTTGLGCPIPLTEYSRVLLAHGGGGRLTYDLIRKLFASRFDNEHLQTLHDGALLPLQNSRLAFSTDSFVVHPIFFPGGTIGDLAVNGTVNDLAMCGAQPLYLSAAFIIEEGMKMADLWRVVVSMQEAAQNAGVTVVTGDTKVVDRGKGDSLFITTSGIGAIKKGIEIHPSRVQEGDVVILSGSIAVHGIAIMSVREGLEFTSEIRSDSAPLHGMVEKILEAGSAVHVLRDPTRGGLASALNEIAESAHVGITIEEDSIRVPDEVRGACEILGLDPLYVANEGKLVAFVSPEAADEVLRSMREHPLGREAAVIGHVGTQHPGVVIMNTRIGGSRLVDMLSGEQLPRIC